MSVCSLNWVMSALFQGDVRDFSITAFQHRSALSVPDGEHVGGLGVGG
jgi:hypothetical protein